MGRAVIAVLMLPTRLPFVPIGLAVIINWLIATTGWYLLMASQAQAGQLALASYVEVGLGLTAAGLLLWATNFVAQRTFLWLWLAFSPWLVAGALVVLLVAQMGDLIPIALLIWAILGVWGYVHFHPLDRFISWLFSSPADDRLHKARFARREEVAHLRASTPPSDGLLMGMDGKHYMAVGSLPHRRELGNVLVVGPTRCGKGLAAVVQLLSWGQSVIVNDIKGELFARTAGYRSRLGPVYVLDPVRGEGHRYDPLAKCQSEDELRSAATQIIDPSNGEGKAFDDRAVSMLAALLAAAKIEGASSLPYVRSMIRATLQPAAAHLNSLDPQLCRDLLDGDYGKVNFDDGYLRSSWSTLTTKLRPLLTDQLVRSFNGSEFSPAELMLSTQPVTVYLRWREQELERLAPMIRVVWASMISELIGVYDHRDGKGCRPVLCLIDEAGRSPVPSLAQHASTVVGRGINLMVVIQDLSQLETNYGRSRAMSLRANCETQVYFPPTQDLKTATEIQDRLGKESRFGRSETIREGEQTSEGRSEQGVPLKTASEIMHAAEEQLIVFHRHYHAMPLTRIDWRGNQELEAKMQLAPPILSSLPAVESFMPTGSAAGTTANGRKTFAGHRNPDDHLF